MYVGKDERKAVRSNTSIIAEGEENIVRSVCERQKLYSCGE